MTPVRVVFTTLFLGILTGQQAVELSVEGVPAVVELRLDGAVVAALNAPPWRAVVDFGVDPLPHELVAVARDDEGVEVARGRQFVNLARPPAEVELLVERDMAGRPVAARVAWGNVSGRQRPEIAMRLDGQALAVDSGGRAALPPGLQGSTAHVLSVELRFSPAVTARRDLVLGGELRDEVSTEATALPLAGAALPLSPAEIDGAIGVGARPIPVVALEEGPAQVVLVRSLSAPLAARRLGSVARRPEKFSPSFSGGSPNNRFSLGDVEHGRFDYALERDTQIRILWPVATRSPGASLPTRLFDATPDFEARAGGLLWLLSGISHPDPDAGADGSRFADAVAVAGLQAAAGGRRRAVVLVLAEEPADRSFYLPAQARTYLRALRVPLFVWSLSSKPSELAREWGDVVDVSSPTRLRRAVNDLRRALAAQRIVWLPGLHLPNAVELSAAARSRGLGWAGERPPSLP